MGRVTQLQPHYRVAYLNFNMLGIASLQMPGQYFRIKGPLHKIQDIVGPEYTGPDLTTAISHLVFNAVPIKV